MFFFIFGFICHHILIKNNIKKEKETTLNLLLSNFVSYAPDFEDFILFFLFHDIQKGFYIDIGANDPNEFSVTKAFYDRGWNGINIEPLYDKYNLLLKYRARDVNLNLGAGQKKANASIYRKSYNGYQSYIMYEKIFNNTNIFNISVETMANICHKYVPKEREIQFCKIDVEGGEKNVLLGFDFENFRPKVICIESLINKTLNIPAHKEWENILILNDYQFAYMFHRNRFYFDSRISGLKNKFKNLDYYVKLYKK